jgi:ribosomal protein S18 acetylase RimI-like enzyme
MAHYPANARVRQVGLSLDDPSATVGDARAIAEIHVSSWQTAYRGIMPDAVLDALSLEDRERGWRTSLIEHAADVWVAADHDALLGWISVGNSRDDDAARNTAELWAIYVAPNHCRRGVGRALWSHAAGELSVRGFEQVTLWVLEQNRAALAFYGALGFTIDPSRRRTVELGGAALGKLRLHRSLLFGLA